MKKFFYPLTVILIISFVFHLLFIGKVPPGINNDEAVDAYDAYSILKTGRDHWDKSFPLEFKSFGDYKLPFFIYSLIPAIYLFGLNIFSLRLTAAIFALFLAWGLFMVGKRLFNEKVAFIASFLLIISPLCFSLTRVAHECPLHTFFILLGFYFFIKALKKGSYYLISSIFFALSFYTYHAARLFVPLFLIVLFFILRKRVYRQRKWLLVPFILSAILCLPIFYSLLFGGADARLMQTNITKDIGTLNVLNQKRGACIQRAPFLLCRLIYNKPLIFARKFVVNYLNHLSFNFLFLQGSAKGVMGESNFFYLSILPIFLIGIFYLLKEDKPPALFLLIWLFLAPIADSLTSEGHYGRSFLIVVPICLIGAWGAFKFWKSLKSVFSKKLFIFLLSIFLLFETITFLTDYFFYFPKYYSAYNHYEYKPLFEYLKTIEKDYSQIYISRRFRDTKQYVFYLFYNKYDPKKFQEESNVEWKIEQGGWIWVKRVGKWHFIDSIPSLETIPDNSLLIGATKEEIGKLKTSEDQKEETVIKPLKTIYFLNGDPAFSVVAVEKI